MTVLRKILLILSIILLSSSSSNAKENDVDLFTECFNALSTCEFQATKKQKGDMNVCLAGKKFLESNCKGTVMEPHIHEEYLNIGVLYYYKNDKLNARDYLLKAAKLGNLKAQKNLDILCKESPWACK